MPVGNLRRFEPEADAASHVSLGEGYLGEAVNL